LPDYRVLAALIGISAGQVSRHMGRLMDAGAFTIRRRRGRLYIAEFDADPSLASASAKNPTKPNWPSSPSQRDRCPTAWRSP
jgi:DNA-binding transcriptional MocR family regulator